jgi:HPt (histidine-containing phosphotransfer) domain-containing protein
MFLQNGFDDFMSKPIDLRQLNALLNRLVRDTQPPEVIEAARRQQTAQNDSASSMDPAELAKVFVRDAQHAVATLETIFQHKCRRTDDMHMFVITVHAMKSALANIGEPELSAVASSLEQAGRAADADVILAASPAFMSALRALIEKNTPAEEDEGGAASDEDLAFLRDKLSIVQAACAEYDIRVAEATLAEIRQKAWPRQIREQLDAVAWHLLHSEFEEAAECCGRVLSEGTTPC